MPQKKPAKLTVRRLARAGALVLGLSLWMVATSYLAAYLVALIFGLFLDSGTLLSTPPLLALYMALIYLVQTVLLIFVPWVFWRFWQRRSTTRQKSTDHKDQHMLWRPTRQGLGLSGLPKWSDLGLAPAALIICLLVSGVLISLCANLPGFDANAEQSLGFDRYLQHWDLLAAFIALVIVPPIFEEIAYRGWFFGILRQRFGFVISALVVSLVFGCMHAPASVAVTTFVLSLLGCGLRELTGNVYASMLMHMLKNGLAFWLLYILHIG